jgi:hypothetical protein
VLGMSIMRRERASCGLSGDGLLNFGDRGRLGSSSVTVGDDMLRRQRACLRCSECQHASTLDGAYESEP